MFNYENKMMRTLNKIMDSLMLGLLWLICSLPILTVGAASSAFYYAFIKSIRQESGYPWKEFFHGFKISFKQATVIWLLLLVLLLVLFIDINILNSDVLDLGNSTAFLLGASSLIVLTAVMLALYIFAYIARFENKLKVLLKNSFIIMMANLPWSFLLLLLFAACVLLFLLAPAIGLFLPAVYMVFASRILERVFRKYMLPEDLQAQKELDYNN